MDGLLRAVGGGIASLVDTAFETIGGALRAIIRGAETALPGGWLLVVAFVVLLAGAWVLAKR
ncbi:MAG TPA: hypothetical protein VFK54_11385 [Candidatus Limnocylindrales bacterium]|nr:hypothetical protein [Candidatus Limnocylindrales bacterium]